MAEPALNNIERHTVLSGINGEAVPERFWFAQGFGNASLLHHALDLLPSHCAIPRPKACLRSTIRRRYCQCDQFYESPRHRNGTKHTTLSLLECFEHDSFIAHIHTLCAERQYLKYSRACEYQSQAKSSYCSTFGDGC